MRYGPYACPECKGRGVTECDCCGREQDCEHCRGLGYDPDKIDLDAYEAACKALGPGATWAAVVGKQVVGRTDGNETVLVDDFRKSAGVTLAGGRESVQ